MTAIRVEYEGNTYEFRHDHDDNGFWISTSGKRKNMTVPLMLATELEKQAIENGISQAVFYRPRKENDESVRIQAKSSTKKSKFAVSLAALVKKRTNPEEEGE